MKFVVLSDIHYVAKSMIIDNKNDVIDNAVSRQALLDASSFDDIDTILITGDLTDKGDKESHLELIELLRSIKKTGKKIYVTTATHDFNHHRALTRRRGDTKAEFAESPWNMPFFDTDKADYASYLKDGFEYSSVEEITPALAECFAPEELWELYREFGRDDAYSVCEGGYSYCIDLDEDTRCLMLNDNFRNEEAMQDISVTYSPSCFRWIDKMIKEAKSDGKFIFACTHHPLVPPSPAYRIGAKNRDMRTPYTVHILADMGLNLVFTGHTHFVDVGFAKSNEGNTLCDISTPSVRFYPPAYRIVDLDGKNSLVDYKITDVSVPSDIEIGENSMREYYRKRMYNEYLNKMSGLKKPLDKIVTDMRIKNFYFLIKNSAKLSESEYESVKDMKFFDLVISAVFNMLAGDGGYTPDSPEYKVLMGLAAMIDSIIDAQPFVNLKSKLLKGYSACQVIEPLCFNNLVSDNEAKLEFSRIPDEKYNLSAVKSYAGDFVMALLCVLAVPVSKLLPYVAVIGLPAVTVAKKIKLKKNPSVPEHIY